jgi:folate-binding Fe-S cluster repair protein YgfZ
MTKEQPQNRKIIEVSGSDREKFLQGLTTNALPRRCRRAALQRDPEPAR